MSPQSADSGWRFVFGSAFPDKVVDARQISEMTGIDENFLINKVGIDRRHVLEEGQQALDLAERSARVALDKASIAPARLDGLIFVTQNPDYVLPQSSALLGDRLGCDTGLASFDISLGCSGWVYAIAVATAFADAQGLDHVAVVTCDTYTPRLAEDDKSTRAVFGDGAATTLLIRGGDYRLGKGVYGTDGSSGLELSAEGGELNAAGQAVAPTIRMNGRSILEFMLSRVPDSVRQCLEKNDLSIEDVDCFAFHQASEYMVRLLIREMELDSARVPINIDGIGNTVSSTIPILLEAVFEKQPPPEKIIVSGFGVGLSWATNYIYRKTG